jgi:hypothetical protein
MGALLPRPHFCRTALLAPAGGKHVAKPLRCGRQSRMPALNNANCARDDRVSDALGDDDGMSESQAGDLLLELPQVDQFL